MQADPVTGPDGTLAGVLRERGQAVPHVTDATEWAPSGTSAYARPRHGLVPIVVVCVTAKHWTPRECPPTAEEIKSKVGVCRQLCTHGRAHSRRRGRSVGSRPSVETREDFRSGRQHAAASGKGMSLAWGCQDVLGPRLRGVVADAVDMLSERHALSVPSALP